MAPFDFKSDKHFVASSDGTALRVYELAKPTLILDPCSIRKAHWKVVANINTNLEYDENDDYADMAEEEEEEEEKTSSLYDGLSFFEGYGRIEGRAALTRLAQHLRGLRLMVSPQGYCFQDAKALGEYADFGAHYLRLNDLFSWPRHGVGLATTTTWGRSELKYRVPRHGKSSKHTPDRVVSMEKYEELERAVKEKEEELEKLKDEKDDELEKIEEENETKIAQLERALEECRAGSWSRPYVGGDIFWGKSKDEAWAIHVRQRRAVPPETFIFDNRKTTFRNRYAPKITEGQEHFHYEVTLLLDEEMTASALLPPKVQVETRFPGQFDVNNWWFCKTCHHEGGLTMLAYYDGDRDRVRASTEVTGRPISLPYPKGADFYADRSFFLSSVGNGIRLAFAYRS